MADEFSLRDTLEDEANDSKDSADKIGDKIKDKAKDKAGEKAKDSMSKHVANTGAKEASKAAAQTAETANAAGANAAASTAGAIGGTGAAAGGSAAGSAAAAGAAGGPVGLAIGVIVGAVIVASQQLKSDGTIDPKGKAGEEAAGLVGDVLGIIIGIICFFVLIVVFAGTLLSKGIASPISVGQETEFQNTVVEGENMSQAGEQYKEGTEELSEYDAEQPLKNSIIKFINGPAGDGLEDGLRATLDKALRKHCKAVITELESHLGKIEGHPYNSDKSLSSFYQNPFPYDLGTEEYTPRIGDVFIPNQLFDGVEYKEWNARYDDVNYAEILAIFGMSNSINGATYGFDWGDINYEDFMAFLQKEECYKYMYELGLEWVPLYVGTRSVLQDDGTYADEEYTVEPYSFDSAEACAGADLEYVDVDGTVCTWDEYYVRVTVKPFGLQELFAMAFATDKPTVAADQMHINFDQHTNLYMLNYIERVTRLYTRGQKTYFKVDNVIVGEQDALGPSSSLPRSPYSSIIEDLKNDPWLIEHNCAGTGRSAWRYLEKTYNDELSDITWGEDPGGATAEGEDFTAPENAKILDMYEYINQGWYPNTYRGSSNDTVAKSGCLDCSVAMIAMYYKRYHISITDVSKYTDSDGALHTTDALASFGLTMGSNHRENVVDGIINEINEDRPVIVHIKGRWVSGVTGDVLHSSGNGHFLVCIGYDETGLYVQDPGNQENYHIAYSDWSQVNDLYYRPVYP